MRFEEKPFGAKMLLTNTNNLVQTDLQELLPTKRNHLGNKEGAKAKREEHKQNAGHDQEAKGTMAYGGYGLRFLEQSQVLTPVTRWISSKKKN